MGGTAVYLSRHTKKRLRERAGSDREVIENYLSSSATADATYERSGDGGLLFVPGLSGYFVVFPHIRQKGAFFAASYLYSWFGKSGRGRRENVKIKFVDYGHPEK